MHSLLHPLENYWTSIPVSKIRSHKLKLHLMLVRCIHSVDFRCPYNSLLYIIFAVTIVIIFDAHHTFVIKLEMPCFKSVSAERLDYFIQA